MDEHLTLPGTLSGLLRMGSPVFADCAAGIVRGVVVGPDDRPEDERHGPWVVASLDEWPDCEATEWAESSRSFKGEELSLNLEDATGRAHAAWWLMRTLAKTRPAFTPRNLPYEVAFWGRGIGWCLFHPDIESFEWVPIDYEGWPPDWRGGISIESDALDSLDPNDDTRLPDGSRWVDAEALRRVCLHVGARKDDDAAYRADSSL